MTSVCFSPFPNKYVLHFFYSSELRYLEKANATQYHEYFPAALIIYHDDGASAIRMDVFFSGNSLHSLAATLNVISNFELQLIPNANYRIRATNAPMHRWVYQNTLEYFRRIFTILIGNLIFFTFVLISIGIQNLYTNQQNRFGCVRDVFADGHVLLCTVLCVDAIQ